MKRSQFGFAFAWLGAVGLLLALNLVSGTALADNRPLFKIRKTVNPQNLVQTFIPVGADCKLGDIDFYWLMDGSKVKQPNPILRCAILSRLHTMPADPGNKAGCPKKLSAGELCNSKFLLAEEITRVGKATPLVIRATRSGPAGTCSVAAFMDLGSKVVQVKQLNTNGRILDRGLTGATIETVSLEVIGTDDQVAATYICQKDCISKETVGAGCVL